KTRTSLDFYNWVFGNYFSLNTEILFNGIHMDKLSIGQKGTVLLKIFLGEGDHPLIIDEPEENLDNKFVYEALVDAFREAKKRRQIIIATHNANLVVNTDAEQVIVAEFENNKISYRWGSIEDPMIRKDITTLLEGGEEAFKRRERKYAL
ncbi:ATP-binding protein, partial [Thermococci archaeon]